MSAFLSGAETAFFGISPSELFQLKDSKSTSSRLVFKLLERPKRLLATLLIAVDFVNISIVVISSLLIQQMFNFSHHEVLGFLIQVVALTFIIALFCEVMPKVWATQNAISFSKLSSFPIYALDKVLRPFTALLVASSSFVDKRIVLKGYDVSADELTHAIDITSDKNTPEEEKKILKGIARFGNIDVKQIMKPRMDVIAFDREMTFHEIFPVIVENKYSRVPVFMDSLDTVIGVLYIKDLLPFLDKEKEENFDWLKLLRPAYFVPESKKINDLLHEFQEKKIHLAIVIDEYGGSSGIVTLEDILEEIVGEINDEYDDEELSYSKLDDFNFVFEGKTLLNDLCRVMEIDRKLLETESEDQADTLAGLLLELKGGIPERNEVLTYNGMKFTIESADRKRIKRVKISLPDSGSDINSSGKSTLPLILIPLIACLLFSGCEEDYVPKPRGYFRIEMPEKNYVKYQPADCPYSFDIPSYSTVAPDPSPRAEACWINVEYTPFKGTLYLSYKELNNNLGKHIEDSRSLSMKHISKASGIEEEMLLDAVNKKYGSIFHVKGSAASALQFYLTDSTKHFIRGSLYFYASPNPDSLAPVLNFVEKDIKQMLESFRWN
ncbi:MAG: gliding motility lipoprotein GldD [Bacteroidia bacterium]|nr:gliding motility lipoprotein GldD [Bacteroidia bacterium]